MNEPAEQASTRALSRPERSKTKPRAALLKVLGTRLQYPALRIWAMLMGCFPIELNLRTARVMGRVWWLLMKRHRERAMENLRYAFGDQYDESRLREIAKRSFEHFAQVFLVELVMTPRLITEWSWSRHVELDNLGPALRELLGKRATIMLTPHFGNFELMGYTIAKLGLPIVAIMRPLDDPRANDFLVRTRKAGGLTVLFKKGAMEAADGILRDAGSLCFIADQDAGRKGVFVDFFGRKASTYKSIGLLAMRHRAAIVVGSAARTRRGFHYRISVERIIQPEEWELKDNPLLWVTQEFSHAMERSIRRHPEQYLWMHRRWRHRPKEERQAEGAAAGDDGR